MVGNYRKRQALKIKIVQVQNLNLILTTLKHTGKFLNSLSFRCPKYLSTMRVVTPSLNESLCAKYLSHSKFFMQINKSYHYYHLFLYKRVRKCKKKINISTCSSLKNVTLSTATYIFQLNQPCTGNINIINSSTGFL